MPYSIVETPMQCVIVTKEDGTVCKYTYRPEEQELFLKFLSGHSGGAHVLKAKAAGLTCSCVTRILHGAIFKWEEDDKDKLLLSMDLCSLAFLDYDQKIIGAVSINLSMGEFLREFGVRVSETLI